MTRPWLRHAAIFHVTTQRYRIDLSAHIAECDANYLRLMKLAPDLDTAQQRVLVLVVADRCVTVSIRLLERCPYTSLVEVSQHPWLEGLAFTLPQPRLTVRMYHDARSAEVMMTAEPPSETSEQSSRCRGSAIMREASTSSTVIGSRICAAGFRPACVRAWTATEASCSGVVP